MAQSCPVCQAPTFVLHTETRKTSGLVVRRYQCFNNLHRFSTSESIIQASIKTYPQPKEVKK